MTRWWSAMLARDLDGEAKARRYVDRVNRLLGPSVSTPARQLDGRPAHYRLFRWDCPCCWAGLQDPAGIYKPFWISSDGQVGCDACHATATQLTGALTLMSGHENDMRRERMLTELRRRRYAG